MTELFLVSDPVSSLDIWSNMIVTTVWARDDVAFMLVDATVLFAVPAETSNRVTLRVTVRVTTRTKAGNFKLKTSNCGSNMAVEKTYCIV